MVNRSVVGSRMVKGSVMGSRMMNRSMVRSGVRGMVRSRMGSTISWFWMRMRMDSKRI